MTDEDKYEPTKQDQFRANWNMNEGISWRTNNTLYKIDFYFETIFGGDNTDMRDYVRQLYANLRVMNTELRRIGQNKEFEKNLDKLDLMSNKWVRVARRNHGIIVPEELYNLIEICIIQLKETIQKQGWGISSERRHDNDTDDFNLV